MWISEARAIAVQWVREHASDRGDFRGAFLSGSVAARSADHAFAATSDVDVVVVLAGDQAPLKLGKFMYGGVLLEVTYMAAAELADADHVAATYHLAQSFSRNTIIDDPTGHLQRLWHAISPTFATPAAIERRCENAITKIERGLSAMDPSAQWHDQVIGWMFPTSITTHVILVAALQNPTVRLRYLAARAVLRGHGLARLYPPLLDLLGCTNASREQVQHHLDSLATTFDATAEVARTPWFFSSDITAAARPIAINGSQALIDAGDHREAIFWIVATYARCQKILAVDSPADLWPRREPHFRAAVEELLNVGSSCDLVDRRAAVRDFIPTLRSSARVIAAA